MARLDQRISALETAQIAINLKAMTDEEIDAHVRKLEFGSPAFYDAVLARVLQRPSAFPIVINDPERKGAQHGMP